MKRLLVGMTSLFVGMESTPPQALPNLTDAFAYSVDLMKAIIKRKQDSQETDDDIPDEEELDREMAEDPEA